MKAPLFPRDTTTWAALELPAWRAVTLSTVETAVLTGIVVRAFRALMLTRGTRIDAESGAGRVTDRGLGRARVERSGGPAGGHLRATLGRGEGAVRLRTGAGNVTVGGATDIDGTESGQAEP